MRETKKGPSPRKGLLVHLVLVAAVGFGCYIQTVGYDFVYDDTVQIALNPRIRSFSNIGTALSENFWAFRSRDYFTNYYRPMQTLSYMAGYAASGLSPWAYHVTNVLLHVCACLAIYWIALQLFGDPTIAFWGSLFFAVHPMHTESVAWIAGITDVGCGLFYFLALGSYLMWRRRNKRCKIWLAISLVSFLIALLYKEMALTLPAALLLIDFAGNQGMKREGIRNPMMRVSPYLGVMLIYAGLRIYALGTFAHSVQEFPMGLAEMIGTMAYLIGRYLQDLIAPFSHNAYHVFRPISRLGFVEWGIPLAILAGGTLLAWKYWSRERRLVLLALLSIVSLVPVLYLGGVGQNVYTERYLYIPSFGFCLLLAALVPRCWSGIRARVLIQTSIVVVFALLTVHRNAVWSDEETLYADTLHVSPDAVPILNNFGRILFEKRRLTEAGRQFQTALEASSKALVHSNREVATSLLGLSSVANAEGRIDDAWKYAEEARQIMPEWADAYATLGMLTAKRGNNAEAERLLRAALVLQPQHAAARVNLGTVLMNRGAFPEAEKEIRQAILVDPNLAGARVALAIVLSRTGRVPEALQSLREALSLDPANEHARALLEQLSKFQTGR